MSVTSVLVITHACKHSIACIITCISIVCVLPLEHPRFNLHTTCCYILYSNLLIDRNVYLIIPAHKPVSSCKAPFFFISRRHSAARQERKDFIALYSRLTPKKDYDTSRYIFTTIGSIKGHLCILSQFLTQWNSTPQHINRPQLTLLDKIFTKLYSHFMIL